MSTFEIVRGVEGDCLVLDGTRICGPKPWGGGRIIKTFHTDGIYEVIYKDEYRKLMAENAKLRELVRDMWEACPADGYYCIYHCEHYDKESESHCKLEDRMRELGVEVTDHDCD